MNTKRMAVNGRRKRDTTACIYNVESKKAWEDSTTRDEQCPIKPSAKQRDKGGGSRRVGVGVVKTRRKLSKYM